MTIIDDTGLHCLDCGYNLTGLTSDRCPECGVHIVWTLVRTESESRRRGTPVYRARGWGRVPATVHTVGIMLFAPWRFADRLRTDEPIGPPMLTAVTAYVLFLGGIFITNGDLPRSKEVAEMALAIGCVILAQSLGLATLGRAHDMPTRRWRRRFRMWLMVSLYSTCFVAMWPITDAPPILTAWNEANFYWFFGTSGRSFFTRELGVSVMVYWWWLILAVVLVVRTRPRWLAVVGIAGLPLFTALGPIVAGPLEFLW